MSLRVGPEAEHREASNSCEKIRNDLVACLQNSPCMKDGGEFWDCMRNEDWREVTVECLALKKTYAQCRRNLLNPSLKLRGNLLHR
ncbi:cytochrome c family oxidase assembly protein pet191 [Cyclospora cayetanensis]|uniref:Cytochrome c family oxidase assembly protein pet191 n=1 Tax=Cyclospora cayetanensis TaxID=88456 RepID=A0A1D3CRE9_9EIME|nr:cytochrome c family oxidase assembly protein pet191 [Cyclospora cayetanensis]